MNISYNWLRDLIEIDLKPAEVGNALTRVGLAVEGIHVHGNDHVLDIDLTSNRPDCLSHLGIARELAAITGKSLLFEPNFQNEVPLPVVLSNEVVSIEETELCSRFTARIVRNVKIGPSPAWLIDRLESIGERSINNVADITNYVMHELGQPMHAFDLDKLEGKRIIVRRAFENEKLTTLDETEHVLDPAVLAICDARKAVSVAGIIGGLDSAISDSTVNVLLEVACFDRANIRNTTRKLNINTEASYRFERGVDFGNIVRASNRATELILELAGGIPDDLVDVNPTIPISQIVDSKNIAAGVKRLTDIDTDTTECKGILANLGIHEDRTAAGNDGSTRFVSPSWRHDITIEEDLVEEIVRHIGYEKIECKLPPAAGSGEYQHNELRKKRIRQVLTGIGFDEAITYSFIDVRSDEVFETVSGISDEHLVTLQDSIIDGAVRMRPSILPGLLAAAKLNFNHQRRDIKLFEGGKAFSGGGGSDVPPNEQELLSLLLTGGERLEGQASAVREVDFYDAKGALEAAMASIGIGTIEFRAKNVKHLREGQAAAVIVNGDDVGSVGRLSDAVASRYKFKQTVYVAEINMAMLWKNDTDPVIYRPLPKYPGISRDLSLIVKRTTEFASIKKEIIESGTDLLESVEFVDLFEGKGIADGERSITVRLNYQSDERTLIDEEVDTLHQQIVEKLRESLGVTLRTQ